MRLYSIVFYVIYNCLNQSNRNHSNIEQQIKAKQSKSVAIETKWQRCLINDLAALTAPLHPIATDEMRFKALWSVTQLKIRTNDLN